MILVSAFLLFLFDVVSSVETMNSLVSIEENLKQHILHHLKMDDVPQISKEEFEKFQIPPQIKMRYELLAWKNKVDWETVNKKKRNAEPSLAGLFKEVRKNSSIHGNFVYISTFREKLRFDMEGRIPKRSRISAAQLRLFKKLPNFNRRFPTESRSRFAPHTNRHQLKPAARWRSTKVQHARVSVYHTLLREDGTERSSLIDSRLIIVNGSGWQSFDVTKAVREWQNHPAKYMSITLELRIESSRPGRAAAEIARMVRFTGQKVSSKSPQRPELVLFTEREEKLKSNDCPQSIRRGSSRKCCRERNYVNFREMSWAQFWIVEPAGYEAYRCSGRCRPSKRKTTLGALRSCTAAESVPLTIMYLIKRSGVTQVQITEFPNMVIERCTCSAEGLFAV